MPARTTLVVSSAPGPLPRRRGGGAALRSRRIGAIALAWLLALVACHGTGALGAPASRSLRPGRDRQRGATRSGRTSGRTCPWATSAGERHRSPTLLAAEVLSKMDLAEKIDFVVIRFDGPYENELGGIPSLCIPPLVLQDGAAGVAYHARGVTQLPAPLGVAASFDTSLAYGYGRLEAEEARGKGIDVVQAPSANLDRVPEAGRAFETYGEDPELASALAVADIEGIQSTGLVAEVTHYSAYTQETDRTSLDQAVSQRALQEVYLAPFRAAVEQAHVGSVMCAYGAIDGRPACQDPALLGELGRWGFDGFVRSDLAAVASSVSAFAAGVDAVKPASPAHLAALVGSGRLPIARLDQAVSHVLATMFRFGLVAHPIPLRPDAVVDPPAHAAFALRAGEESIVLLQNRHSLLPLSRLRSLALIGAGAGGAAMTTGGGSATVVAPFVSTPLAAIRAAVGRRCALSYVAPTASARPLPSIVAPALRARKVELLASSLLAQGGGDQASAPGRVSPRARRAPRAGAARLAVEQLRLEGLIHDGATGTGSIPPRDFGLLDHLSLSVVAPRSGLFAISLTGRGDSWLSLDGHLLLADTGEHVSSTWQVAAELSAHRRYDLSLTWFPVLGMRIPRIGWQDETPVIERAAEAARHAQVAVVVADAPSSEGVDRPNLSLPGVQDALISAVAAANRNTVVVLDTPGAVAMPWLGRVAAVLEAFYPGEQDGRTLAAVLFGTVDPSGHLPVSFPSSGDGVPVGGQLSWPGVDGTVDFAGGIDLGYRWDAAEHLRPAFPFGFGLSYTEFQLSDLRVTTKGGAAVARVALRNVGRRSGTEVVQAYLGFPAAAAEPPVQLVAFARVTLAPHGSATVSLLVARRAFEAFLGGRFRVVAGRYELRVGTSSADLPLAATLDAPRRIGPPAA